MNIFRSKGLLHRTSNTIVELGFRVLLLIGLALPVPGAIVGFCLKFFLGVDILDQLTSLWHFGLILWLGSIAVNGIIFLPLSVIMKWSNSNIGLFDGRDGAGGYDDDSGGGE